MIVYKHARIQDNVLSSKLSVSFHFELFPWNPIFGMFAMQHIIEKMYFMHFNSYSTINDIIDLLLQNLHNFS